MMQHEDITDKVIGSFYDVYNELGYGFLESVYESAMCVALREKSLEVECQLPLSVWFRGINVGSFRTDILVNRSVIVELKASKGLESAYEAQLLNYLKASEVEVGLLMNFGEKPEFKRLIFDNARKQSHKLRKKTDPSNP